MRDKLVNMLHPCKRSRTRETRELEGSSHGYRLYWVPNSRPANPHNEKYLFFPKKL
jgi:hypothetical protein